MCRLVLIKDRIFTECQFSISFEKLSRHYLDIVNKDLLLLLLLLLLRYYMIFLYRPVTCICREFIKKYL